MDQSRDSSGRGLYRLIQMFPPPEYVKQASAEDLLGHPGLPAHAYADPLHKLYPCHTPAATWTSYGFYLQKRGEYRPDDARAVDDRFERYGRFHNVLASLEEIRKTAESRQKVTSEEDLPDAAFAIIIKAADGTVERHCPIRNAREAVLAADYLKSWRDEFPFDIRRAAAEVILEKAAAFGAALDEYEEFLERQAGHGCCSAQSLGNFIVDRVQASRRGPGLLSPQQRELLKMAQLCAEKPSQVREPGTLVKIASIIDQFDRENGLARDYGPDLPRPEDVLFELTREKMASVVRDHCSTVTGSLYKMADLERVRLRDLRDNMGTDFAEAVSDDGMHLNAEKLAAIVPTLPRGDAELFDRLMEDLGVLPMAKEASAMQTKISRDYMRQMAEDYRAKLGEHAPQKRVRPGGLLSQFGK